MTNKILGATAMACAPFLCIDFLLHGVNGPNEQFEHNSLSGLLNLLYMIGWVCSIIVLKRVKATGTKTFGVFILNAQLVTLTLANVWNIYEIISPGSTSMVYFILDFSWPVSNLVLLIVGITAVFARRLPGGMRFVPLMAGLWLPVSATLMMTIGPTYLTMVISGCYSAVSWLLLGRMCYRMPERQYIPEPVALGAV